MREEVEKNNARYYVDGSAARQIRELPKYNDFEESISTEKSKQKVRTKRKKKPAVDFYAFTILTAGIALMLWTCVTYLQVQSGITSMNKEISTLESNLTKLENENSTMETIVNTSMDLNYIYKIATNDLGMVYPKDNQVIDYESTISDYVRQYGDIPEAKKPSILDRILK